MLLRGQPCESNVGTVRNLEVESGGTMQLQCCNKDVCCGEVWFLNDVKGFTARKMFIGKCSVCNNEVAILIEKRIKDNKVYANELKGIDAVKTIFREKQRKVSVLPNIKTNSLYGWVYGTNIQIKNKKGKVLQVRQYSTDFNGNKELIKKIIYN
jgi:hypothetical protein